ncbi:zinc finger, CCHC-type containing protein [Tanacetum coccineum]
MKLVHLGIEKGSKAYRLLDPDTGKLYVSRDVIFEEDQVWGWEKSTKVKATPGMSFTIEGFNTDEFYDDDFEPEPDSPQSDQIASQSDSDWTEQGPEPIIPPVSPASPVTPNVNDQFSQHRLKFYRRWRPKTLPFAHRSQARKESGSKLWMPNYHQLKRTKPGPLVDLPKNRKAIDLKWVYKVKRDPSRKTSKYKARVVVKGYVQKRGVDYDEVFAPVARIETVRVILALAGSNGWRVHHLDVKSAFLNGTLEEEVYVSQPEGYIKKGEANKVYKLSKALYGLKQAPRAWNACLDKYLKSLGDWELSQEYSGFQEDYEGKFEMSDLGLLSYYLGIEVNQQETGITLKQEAYARSILTKTRMIKCNPNKRPMEHKLKLTKDGEGELINPTEYRSIVGGLRYLTALSEHFMLLLDWLVDSWRSHEKHLQAVKGHLDVNDRKSTGGMAFYVNGNLVTWASQKQRVVALSSCEAEFIAATMAACQGIWLRRLLTEITKQRVPPVTLFVDNQSALELMKNPVFHGRSKHIDIRYHFIRVLVKMEKSQLVMFV